MKMKVAAFHAAPVFMNKKATIEKVITTIKRAATQGVETLVFPEVFVPGYPCVIWAYAPLEYFKWFKDYADESFLLFEPESVSSGSPKASADLIPILKACKDARINIVLGVSERSSFSSETLFNSQVFISNGGDLLGVHRKLVPTGAERTIWAYGGGSTMKCWDVPGPGGATFKAGGLCCGENLNLGAKLALIDQGQQVHAASWPDQCAVSAMSDSWKNIKLLAQAHSAEAMCFTISASSIMSEEELAWMTETFGEQHSLVPGSGWSGVVSPRGAVLAEDCGGLEEHLIVAEIDLDSIPGAKFSNDPAGHYRRPEVLKLEVNRAPIWPDDAYVANGLRVGSN